jgi:hypothetical protein
MPAVGRRFRIRSRDRARSTYRDPRDRSRAFRASRPIARARFELETRDRSRDARGAGAAPARDRDGATMPTTTMPTTTRAMTMRATMRATRATRAVRARCATGRARDARVSAQMGPELRESIDAFVAEHRVVLFMKGTKDAPRCGFSNTCVQILNSMNVPFADVDILANEDLRQGMKCVGARRRERERERTTSRTTAR